MIYPSPLLLDIQRSTSSTAQPGDSSLEVPPSIILTSRHCAPISPTLFSTPTPPDILNLGSFAFLVPLGGLSNIIVVAVSGLFDIFYQYSIFNGSGASHITAVDFGLIPLRIATQNLRDVDGSGSFLGLYSQNNLRIVSNTVPPTVEGSLSVFVSRRL